MVGALPRVGVPEIVPVVGLKVSPVLVVILGLIETEVTPEPKLGTIEPITDATGKLKGDPATPMVKFSSSAVMVMDTLAVFEFASVTVKVNTVETSSVFGVPEISPVMLSKVNPNAVISGEIETETTSLPKVGTMTPGASAIFSVNTNVDPAIEIDKFETCNGVAVFGAVRSTGAQLEDNNPHMTQTKNGWMKIDFKKSGEK